MRWSPQPQLWVGNAGHPHYRVQAPALWRSRHKQAFAQRNRGMPKEHEGWGGGDVLDFQGLDGLPVPGCVWARPWGSACILLPWGVHQHHIELSAKGLHRQLQVRQVCLHTPEPCRACTWCQGSLPIACNTHMPARSSPTRQLLLLGSMQSGLTSSTVCACTQQPHNRTSAGHLPAPPYIRHRCARHVTPNQVCCAFAARLGGQERVGEGPFSATTLPSDQVKASEVTLR